MFSQIQVYTCIRFRLADEATAATDLRLYTMKKRDISQFHILLAPIPELLRKLLIIGLDQVALASSQQRPCGQALSVDLG